MKQQTELWLVLEENESDQIWENVHKKFNFNPKGKSSLSPFTFTIPVDVYNIHDLSQKYETAKKILISSFVKCMNNDEYMYALDWQHTDFRYNPRITTPKEDTFIADERYHGGGYNVYFPSFYPDGDYYFFIAKDFTWGYLTHPWLEKAWVFGNQFRDYIRQNSEDLGLSLCSE
ncbi:MAG: DUF2716 domain-containing protein [Sebaldella sp.]|nr:DUF2716 domain-containing protein [Sebaldella sp.]